MMIYTAFLRGINVGGHKLIGMEELTGIFESLKFKNVKTYLQTGNVIFEATETDCAKLKEKIEKQMQAAFESKTTVVLRTLEEIRERVRQNPFQSKKDLPDAKWYVTFLAEAPKFHPTLPLVSPHKDLQIFSLQERDVFSLGLLGKNGHFGFPNALIESEFGVLATTRNWNTIMKLMA